MRRRFLLTALALVLSPGLAQANPSIWFEGMRARLRLANGRKIEATLQCFDGTRVWGHGGNRRLGVPVSQIAEGMVYVAGAFSSRRWRDKTRVLASDAWRVLPSCAARPVIVSAEHQALLQRVDSARRWQNWSIGLTIAAGAVGVLLLSLEWMAYAYCGYPRYEPRTHSYVAFGSIGAALVIGLPASVTLHNEVEHRMGELRDRVFSVGPASLQGPEGQVPGIQVAGRW